MINKLFPGRWLVIALLLLSVVFSSVSESVVFDFAAPAQIDRSAYEVAKQLLYSRHFDEAFELFDELGDYEDSKDLVKYARRYIESEPEFGDRFFEDKYISRTYPGGKLYSLSTYGNNHNIDIFKGDIWLPDNVNSSTTFVQYFCGGGLGEDYLWYRGMYDYFDEYQPNSIIVFTNESGTARIQGRLEYQWRILQQIAWECGTIVHDLSSIGSSNGCYTAMKLAAAYYTDHGLKTVRTLTLDTGVDWNLNIYALTEDECKAVAEAGTEFYLFEGADFTYDLQDQAVTDILSSGIPVTAVICKHGNHDTISRNAYALGLFSFCGGEDIALADFEYFPVKVTEGMTDLGEISWAEQPENDLRRVYP